MSADLREVLMGIRQQYNQLTPALVVQVAADPDHPLHSRFEWDDTNAADAWRRTQAKDLIRTVKLKYREGDDLRGPAYVRAFHATKPERLGGPIAYEPVEAIAADPVATAVLMRQMERDWQCLRRRYAEFEEFWQLVRVDEAVA